MVFNTRADVSRRTVLRTFLEARIIFWTFPVFEWKNWISGDKDLSGLTKAHFTCPEQQFYKNKMKVDFTTCSLIKTMCVFFLTGDLFYLSVSKPESKYAEEKNRQNFCVAKFSRHLQILSRETASFIEKLQAGLLILQSMCPGEHFQSNFFEARC